MTLPIPFLYSYKIPKTSTTQTVELRFDRNHGKKLRRIYHAPYHNTESGATAYARDNIKGLNTVTSFYSLLNNDRLQEFNVNTANAEDYMILNPRIKDSCFPNVDSYQNNWFWVDDFTSEGPLCKNSSQDITLSSGIDLNSEQKWSIYMTMANAREINHYNFVVTEKELLIRPGQIVVS